MLWIQFTWRILQVLDKQKKKKIYLDSLHAIPTSPTCREIQELRLVNFFKLAIDWYGAGCSKGGLFYPLIAIFATRADESRKIT